MLNCKISQQGKLHNVDVNKKNDFKSHILKLYLETAESLVTSCGFNLFTCWPFNAGSSGTMALFCILSGFKQQTFCRPVKSL